MRRKIVVVISFVIGAGLVATVYALTAGKSVSADHRGETEVQIVPEEVEAEVPSPKDSKNTTMPMRQE